MSARRRAAVALAVAAIATGVSGCAAAEPGDTVTVFAAASLRDTFTQLADDFEARNPGTDVRLNFAGSADLATQIAQGAPADVFASADERTMAQIADAQLTDGAPRAFATNTLEIAVPYANPAAIGGLADLARPGVKLVVCAPQVPCGAAAAELAEAAGVVLAPVSEESSVTDVLGKVLSGEADAGLVYSTDVRATDAEAAGDRVRGIPVPGAGAAATTYPIAALATGANPDAARAFVALVTGADGQKTLHDAGFGTP